MDITHPATEADVEAVTRLVEAVDAAQRTEDAEAFLALFRSDAVWVTRNGKRLYGLPEIAAFTRRVLPGATAESYATYAPAHVLFIRPDVAVVNVDQRYRRHDGAPSDDGVGSPVYVLAKDDGEWRIAAGQNTQVVTDG